MAIIEVDHVTKEYRLGALSSMKQTVLNAGARLMGRQVPERPLFKALDNVSFSIEQGEVVGIIGHNGAGKSTLLKLLANISQPSSGSITVRGKVAPLIEVGAGLVGDLTGRENIFLNGAILGIPRRELKKKFDDIVAFAELEEFIDTPIKRYSSGMHVRLGFAIATSVESDILIVDEVLAVGDLAFQRKCFDRMEELIKRQGKTVLVVSHNIRQIERISQRVILIDHGKIISDGNPQLCCNMFFEQSDNKIRRQAAEITRLQNNATSITTSGELELLSISIHDAFGEQTNTILYRSQITIKIRFMITRLIDTPTFGIGAHTPDMIFVASDDSIFSQHSNFSLQAGEFELKYHVDSLALLPGVYALRVGVAIKDTDRPLFYGENLCHFQVTSGAISRSRTVNQGFVPFGGRWDLTNASTLTFE